MEDVERNLASNALEVPGERVNACDGDTLARSMADAVARHSYGKLVAFLAACTCDVAAAEDALSEAFASALVVLGLDAKMIASTFLMSPSAIGKRLVRAKNKIRQAGIPFRIPEREELAGRLDAVLDTIYAAFAEGRC